MTVKVTILSYNVRCPVCDAVLIVSATFVLPGGEVFLKCTCGYDEPVVLAFPL